MALILLFYYRMRKIAIVDDDASERIVLKGLLMENGFSVVAEGKSGLEALDICRSSTPDLIIMDVRMPGKDGISAALDIGKNCPTPVVLLTASGDEETIRRAAEAGVMGYLMKPIREEGLVPTIELAISRFEEFVMLRKENAELKDALKARKTIEKAKGLLMEREKLNEAEAFARIRKIAMDKRKSMTEIAEVIILAFEKEA
ncbi:MAG: response regulator [Deltaproteobacteria bacterium]|nr:response regulator [Deltaproteobacteria bacterium]